MAWAFCGLAMSCFAIQCLRPSMLGRAGRRAQPLSHQKVFSALCKCTLALVAAAPCHLCVCHCTFTANPSIEPLFGAVLLLIYVAHVGIMSVSAFADAWPLLHQATSTCCKEQAFGQNPALSIDAADVFACPYTCSAGVASPDSRLRGAQSGQQANPNLTPTSAALHSQATRQWTTSTIPSQCLWSNVPAGAR